MNGKRLSFTLLAMLLITPWMHVEAASKVPAVTRDFVKFCDVNAADCANAISMTEVAMLVNAGANDFCVPESAYNNGTLTPESVNKVKAWISAHPALAGEPAQKTLRAAIREVWPMTQACAAEYADHLPKLTGQFVDYCEHDDQSHKEACADAITNVQLASLIKTPGAVCVPDSVYATDATFDLYISTVNEWLKEHKELAAQPRNPSILGAYRALYPCRKP